MLTFRHWSAIIIVIYAECNIFFVGGACGAVSISFYYCQSGRRSSSDAITLKAIAANGDPFVTLTVIIGVDIAFLIDLVVVLKKFLVVTELAISGQFFDSLGELQEFCALKAILLQDHENILVLQFKYASSSHLQWASGNQNPFSL